MKYLTNQEIDALFRAISDPRDRAMFRLAYHRGLRASELGQLQLADYRAAEGRLYVRRLKGSHSNEFPLTQLERSALRDWLRVRGAVIGPLFCSRNHRAISRRRLDELMKRYCNTAGIGPDKAHMHALKHSCGINLLAMLGDVVAVQDHLGHKDIRSTQIYAQFAKREQVPEQLPDWGKKAV